jgi:hypothetical protein
MILQLFILCIPFIAEAGIESYFEKVKKVSVNHFWSAIIRGLLMLAIAIAFQLLGIVLWWQALALMVALHFACFNYLYNLFTNRELTYLRSKGIDGALNNLPWWGVALWQLIILITGLMVYYQIWGFKL